MPSQLGHGWSAAAGISTPPGTGAPEASGRVLFCYHRPPPIVQRLRPLTVPPLPHNCPAGGLIAFATNEVPKALICDSTSPACCHTTMISSFQRVPTDTTTPRFPPPHLPASLHLSHAPARWNQRNKARQTVGTPATQQQSQRAARARLSTASQCSSATSHRVRASPCRLQNSTVDSRRALGVQQAHAARAKHTGSMAARNGAEGLGREGQEKRRGEQGAKQKATAALGWRCCCGNTELWAGEQVAGEHPLQRSAAALLP